LKRQLRGPNQDETTGRSRNSLPRDTGNERGEGTARAHLKFLDVGEENLLHAKTLEILRDIGVLIRSPRVLRMLENSGAVVDRNRATARIPETMVAEARAVTRRLLREHRAPPIEPDIRREGDAVIAELEQRSRA